MRTNRAAKITNEATSSKYNLIFLSSKQQLAGKLPHHNAGRSAHVEAVFGAQLRDFQAAISKVDHTLLHAFHLVSQHHGIAFGRCFGV